MDWSVDLGSTRSGRSGWRPDAPSVPSHRQLVGLLGPAGAMPPPVEASLGEWAMPEWGVLVAILGVVFLVVALGLLLAGFARVQRDDFDG